MGVSRVQPRVMPRVGPPWVSLTQVLEGGCRTLTEGQLSLPRGSYVGQSPFSLPMEGTATAIILPIRWTHLFRQELL